MFRAMGGFGSGRSSGRPLAEHSRRVDIGWMLRAGLAKDGALKSGTLRWHVGDEPAGSVSYTANLCDPDNASLELHYSRGDDGKRETVCQSIRLCHTRPTYGGRRWWMICPYRGHRVLKLYMPSGADRFASARAWRLAWRSQRIAAVDRPFEALFRLQRKLGSYQGWDAGLAPKPKGMWRRTYERHWDDYMALDEMCSVTMGAMMLKFAG
jgi:hypothetical protein